MEIELVLTRGVNLSCMPGAFSMAPGIGKNSSVRCDVMLSAMLMLSSALGACVEANTQASLTLEASSSLGKG